jgi:hypothetical protein
VEVKTKAEILRKINYLRTKKQSSSIKVFKGESRQDGRFSGAFSINHSSLIDISASLNAEKSIIDEEYA